MSSENCFDAKNKSRNFDNRKRRKHKKEFNSNKIEKQNQEKNMNLNVLFETCDLSSTMAVVGSSSFVPPPNNAFNFASSSPEDLPPLPPVVDDGLGNNNKEQNNFTPQKEKENNEDEENKKIDEETKILSEKLLMLQQQTQIIPPPAAVPSSSSSVSPPVTVVTQQPQVTKIKAFVKPYGDYVKLDPEMVLINSKCTIGRIHKVITSKLVELSNAKKEKYAKSSWYERCTGSSEPKHITPSDSVFLRINGILSPSFNQRIADFVNENPSETLTIEYFLQPTFG